MANTHRLVIESSVPPRMTVIAAGPREFCEERQTQWLEEHADEGLDEFEMLRIMRDVSTEREYPFNDGDIVVLGPELFVAKDCSVVCWKGRNYVPQDTVLSEQHVTEALGFMSAEFAHRAGAWDGDAPDWFPEPPEWLELWGQAVEATGPNAPVVDSEALEEVDTEQEVPDVQE